MLSSDVDKVFESGDVRAVSIKNIQVTLFLVHSLSISVLSTRLPFFVLKLVKMIILGVDNCLSILDSSKA